MANRLNQKITVYTLHHTWYGRLLAAVAGALLLLLAIFFFTFFIIIFALLAMVTTVYIFLFGRRHEKTTPPNIIEVEYLISSPEDELEDLHRKKDNDPQS